MKKIIMSMLLVFGLCGSVKPDAAKLDPAVIAAVVAAVQQNMAPKPQSWTSGFLGDGSKILTTLAWNGFFSAVGMAIKYSFEWAMSEPSNEVENPEESQRYQEAVTPVNAPIGITPARAPVAKSPAQLNHEANIRARQQRRR